MANVTTELKVVVRSVGKGEIDKLSKALNDLGSKAAKPVNQTLKDSVGELKKLSSQSKVTRNNVKGFSSAFKELANNLEVGSREFKEATAEAAKLDKQLASLEKRKPTRAQRLRGAARTAGAIAAGGVFGGPEGAIGAGIGGVFGPAGAAVGAAIGAQVGQLRQAAGATAEYAANIAKLRIALKGVTTSQEEYSQGLAFIQQTTKDFAIPQEVVTRQFTKLQASVQGAGGNLEDTKDAFNGIVAAVRATGGSLADVDAALTATAQVFSKGKVSAEELRQQIGERLPGAFTLFAESMGLTPQELDKALEQGKVSLQDFQGFAKAIFDRYGENAKAIAQGPESAGDRLKVALERLNENLGILLKPIGEAFQNIFTDIVNAITNAANALQNFFDRLEAQRRATAQLRGGQSRAQFGRRGGVSARREEFNTLTEQFLEQIRAERGAGGIDVQQPTAGTGLPGIIVDAGGSQAKIKDTSDEILRLTQEMNAARATGQLILAEQLRLQIDIQRITEEFNAGEITFNRAQELSSNAIEKSRERGLKLRDDEKKAMRDLTKGQKDFKKELTETEKLVKSIKDTLATSMASAIEGLIDGTKSFSESLSGVLRQMASLLLNFGTRQLFSLLPFANGGVIAKNKIVPFAYGGIVDKPTLFPMANGAGLMGEAGPEAIMPLRRGRGGRLGVEASGGVGNVVVNVDATGSSVQGDQPNAKALGSAIGAAVQAELIKQKRPGGLLS